MPEQLLELGQAVLNYRTNQTCGVAMQPQVSILAGNVKGTKGGGSLAPLLFLGQHV